MATVPTYQRRVAPQALPQVRVSPQFVDTQAVQQGLDSVANVAVDMAVKQRQEADTTAIIDADNKLTEWQNNAFYNQQNGVYTRKGKNALDVTGQTLDGFDKFQQELGAGLANDTQRKRFAQIVAQRKQGMSNDLNRYEYGQHQQYMNDVDDASIKLSMDSAALNFNDPQKLAQYQQKAMDVVESQAQRNGWAPEVTQARKQKIASSMYTDVLTRQAAMDPYQAQRTLKQVEGSLTADDLVRVGGMIEGKVDRLQQKAEMAQLRAEAKADRALGKISAQIASGIPATDEMWRAWGRQVAGTPAQAEYNELVKQEQATQQVLRMPIDQQAAYYNKLAAQLQNEGGSIAQGNNLARLGRAIESNSKMMTEAPLDYFQQRLEGNVQPLDLNSDELPAVLNDRVAALQGMREKFGPTVGMKPLLPQEAKALSAQLEQMTPDQQSQLFGTLHTAMGDDKAYAGAMQQIAPDSPVRALAGMLAGKQRSLTTGNHWFRPDDVVSSGDVAKTMAIGESILNKSKAEKGQDGGGKFPIPKQNDFNLALGKQLGAVFAGQPQSYALAAQAVKSYYTGAAAEAGDVSGEVNNALMKKAIKATVGDVVDFNGSSTLAPWGMPGDTFEQVAQQRLVETMKAQGMSDSDLATAKALTLRQARDGVYYVMQGNQYKYGADGKPLMLNINGGDQ